MKIKLILAFAVIFLALTAAVTALTTDKPQYEPGELVKITSENLPSNNLVIVSESASFRFLGDIRTSTQFMPRETGTYSVMLEDRNGNKLEETSFEVKEKAPPPLHLSLSKNSYVTGELADIAIQGSILPEHELRIISPKGTYVFIDLKNSLKFSPDTPGSYEAVLLYKGQEAARQAFSVKAKPGPPRKEEIKKIQATAGELKANLQTLKENFRVEETPEFSLTFPAKKNLFAFATNSREPQQNKWETSSEKIVAMVTDTNDALVGVPTEIRKMDEGEFSINIAKKREFRPGKYKLHVQLTKDGQTYVREQNFTWGVLAINTHKSIYLPNETASIGIGVLDDEGRITCDASVMLHITSPSGETTTLSTIDGSIQISDECSFLGVTNLPDYYTHYSVQGAGSYVMNLTASTANGVRTIIDSFEAQQSPAFDVARHGPTRIYPPANYTMAISINPSRNYKGKITEYVPSSFTIIPQQGMTTETLGDTTTIIWNVDLNKGEETTLTYEFDAPDISPEFYLLGQLKIGSWTETRQWQIASDALIKAAGEKEIGILKAQGCNRAINVVTPRTFADACAGSYPTACPPAGSDRLSCSDGSEEAPKPANNAYGGANITAFNNTILTCDGIDSVRICYNWRLGGSFGTSECNVGSHNGDTIWNTTSVACATTTASGLICVDVTLNEPWQCSNFFGSAGSRAGAMIELKHVGGGAARDLLIDVLYYNVTYFRDDIKPNATIITPVAGTNVSGSFLVNASVNDTSNVVRANLTIYNNTGNATGTLKMTLGSGTAIAGYWNITLDSTTLPDGKYNLSINASDGATIPNAGLSTNVTIVIDNKLPNATISAPINVSNLSANFDISASVNDSPAGIFNVSFKLYNSTHNATPRLNAEKDSGTIYQGYWTSTASIAGLRDGLYNISVNATDFAGNQIIANISQVAIDRISPNATIANPVNNTNYSANFLINASVNDSVSRVFNATFRLMNSLESTEWLYSTRNSGTIAAGYWNATFPVSTVADGTFNITINATDFAGNQAVGNISYITIDRAAPEAAAASPKSNTNISGNFLINASISDATTGTYNASFRIINSEYSTQWAYATLGAGTTTAGYWNATADISAIPEGRYNITINATDYVGNQLLSNITYVIIDKTLPNASAVQPLNLTNITGSFLINASVNDSLSTIFNASFRVISQHYSTEWLYSTMNSGTTTSGYWGTTLNTEGISDDKYNITINATDYAGNQKLQNISEIVIDNTGANLTIVLPINSTNFSSDFLINASVNDSPSGIFNTTFRLVNTLAETSWLYATRGSGSIYQGYWNTTISIAAVNDGRYNITANATDFSGNQLIANISQIAIDRTAPNITITTLVNVTNTSADFLINASVNDSVSRVFNATFRLMNSIESTEWLYSELNSGTTDEGHWNTTVAISALQDGLYNITANATDYTGNQMSANISAVLIDRVKGNVSLITPANGSIISVNTLISASANDSASGVKSVKYRLINESTQGLWTDSELSSGNINVGEWSLNFNTFLLVNGVYNITANIIDFAGNQYLVNISEVEIDNIIDEIGPNTTIIRPYFNANISGSFLVNASVNDTVGSIAASNLTIYNNTGNATGWIKMTLGSGTVAAGYWNATFNSLELIDGVYNLSVNSTDANGNVNTSPNISIVIDNTLPNISILLPINESNITADFLINSSVNDTLAKVFNVTFRLVGTQVSAVLGATLGAGSIDHGYWNATFPTLTVADGFYNITINATDYAGNYRPTNLSSIRIDRNAPNISSIWPTNLTNTTSDFTLNISVNDSVSSTFNATLRLANSLATTDWIYLNLSTGNKRIGFWNSTFSVALVSDGRYNVTANATDYAGNQRIINISEVIIDRQSPNATAIIPANNTNFSINFLVNASVNDSLSGVFNSTFRLINQEASTTWLSATIGSGSISQGYWNATIDVAAVNDGKYNITINATDFAGNQKLINISEVAVDKKEPNITIVRPANLTNSSVDFLINASVNDTVTGVFNVSFQLTGTGNSPLLKSTLGSGNILNGYWNATFAIASAIDGFYNITANITDFAGNTRLVNISKVNLDRTAPNATMISPRNITNATASFLINASVNDSVSRVFNATFRLANSDGSSVTEWIYADLNSGTTTAGYWNATFDPAAVPDGRYNITINATDYAGNQRVINLSTLRIDRAGPNATIVVPLNNTNFTQNFIVNVSVNDSVSGTFNTSFRLVNYLETTKWQHLNLSSGSRAAGYWNNTVDVSSINDGTFNITINATDYAGNQVIANISEVRIDRKAPNVTIMVPVNKSLQKGNMLINASVNDSVSKVSTVRYRLMTDDGLTTTEWISATRGAGTTTAGYWNITFGTTSVGDDNYNITIEATDYVGNQKTENISTVEIANNDINAAGENEEAVLRAQSCNREDSTTGQTFSLACLGTYPSACPSNRLSCNDGTSETSALTADEFGGVNMSAYNITVNNCLSVKSVRLCYEWSTSDTRTYSSCSLGVDKAGDLSWATNPATCPTITTDILTCIDITSKEASWNCQDFFGTTTPKVWAYIEGKRTQTGSSHDMNIDALYFNVTYVRDNAAPSTAIVSPLQYANISGNFVVNASVNDTGAAVKVNLTIYNNTGNATGLIMMSLGAGTPTAGYWNATVDSTSLRDGYYNISVNATDATSNINITPNTSIIIDNTFPNASLVSPANNSAFPALNITANISANDSLTGVTGVSFRLSNSSDRTAWAEATKNSGSIQTGYWNATIYATELATGQYNITANVTDFARNQKLVNLSTVNISRADLSINSSEIIFLNESPVEGQNVTINATVTNLGLTDSATFIVEFFNESIADNNRISNATLPGLAAGSYAIVNTTYIAQMGPNNIYVRIDGNNSINEDNETNNQANNTFHVSGYSFYYGNFSRITIIGSADNSTLRTWEPTNGTGNIYAADADSLIDFTALQALNRTIAGDASSNDYAEADRLLNMTNFTDSLAKKYTNNNGLTPHTIISVTVFSSEITDIPATNSTNSTSFLTGILWDTSDDSGNNEYDDNDGEDIVFVTAVDVARQGKYGFYSLEMRIPTNLKKYVQPNAQNNMVFYAELT